MLNGPTKYLGRGFWRDVHLAKYDGQLLAVKTLRKTQDETDRNLQRHQWEAAALDAVSPHNPGMSPRKPYLCYYEFQISFTTAKPQ